jgi:hypothetical protein
MEHEGLGFGRDRPAAKGRRSPLPRATPLRVLILVSARLEVTTSSLLFLNSRPSVILSATRPLTALILRHY